MLRKGGAQWRPFSYVQGPRLERPYESEPVPWDTELTRVTAIKEAGHRDEAEESASAPEPSVTAAS